jgi:hypothetical protein
MQGGNSDEDRCSLKLHIKLEAEEGKYHNMTTAKVTAARKLILTLDVDNQRPGVRSRLSD